MPIRQLPSDVASKIAAGEIIERPASVVKELVENSLDAGATRIETVIREGGVAEIRVSDDGSGIPADEVSLAFLRHATSKLTTVDELQSVATLGFRGEALPSIAAVSRATLTTRATGADSGVRIQLRYGEPAGLDEVGCAPGTTVQAQELFGNLPARRKFLRSSATETARIQEVVSRYALASPGVKFTLTADGRTILDTPGSGRARDAVLSVYGSDIASQMLPVLHRDGDISIDGFVSTPQISRGNRSYMTLLVNHRWVFDGSIAYAITQAYQGMLPDRRYPVAVIDVVIPPHAVDVNSHPSKREVRFRNADRLFSAVNHAVRDALLAHAPVRQVVSVPTPVHTDAPANSAPAQPHLAPGTSHSPVGPRASSGPAPLPTTQLAPSAGSLREVLASLRVVGQIRQTYIVAEGPEGMYLVDQHAAHERVVYDRLRRQAKNQQRISQPLLSPTPCDLSIAQAATMEEYAELLESYGFGIEAFGNNTWLLRAIPASLADGGKGVTDPVQILLELLDAIALEQVVMEREDALAATIACHGSVRAGMNLTIEEMSALLEQLEVTPDPHSCPHGRPTVVRFTEYQLEREFRRR